MSLKGKINRTKSRSCCYAKPFILNSRSGSRRIRCSILTLNDDVALIDYGQPIVNDLRANMVRVDSDLA